MVTSERRATTSRSLSAESAPEGKQPLQIRIPVGVKRRFKSYAALRGLDPNELFVEMWEHYQKTRPSTTTHDSGG